MKLIEKKCPNCGASLEFNEKDKSCTCAYCHRSFEIEREENKEDYNLNEIAVTKSFSILFLIVPIIIFIGIVLLMYNIFKFNVERKHDEFEEKVQKQKEVIKKKKEEIETKDEDIEKLLSSADELSSTILDALNIEATFNIKNAIGNKERSSFNVEERKREKVYVAYKKGSTNYLIAIYKVLYKDFFNQKDMHTLYVPLVYENVRKNAIRLDNTTVSAPEYYFNKDKTTYAYGYSTYEEAYNDVVKPLESEYTITEK